jgi:hypothetical protein
MSSMMIVLLVAGIGFLLAGLVAIGSGIPINEFGFGNTLIVSGTVASCTGMLLLGLWTAVRELKNIARRLGPATEALAEHALQAAPAVATPRQQAAEAALPDNAGSAETATPPPAPSQPWHAEAPPRDRVQNGGAAAPAAEAADAAAAAKPRRNLLFSSTSRKERERAEARTTDPSSSDAHPEPSTAPPAAELRPASFDDAWPRPERSRSVDVAPPRRAVRNPSTFSEDSPAPAGVDRSPPPVRNDDSAQVTVLKSGVVDGMAYSLYSDGSIEAQMPEGMMRFASIDELRAHLDQRP